MVGCRKLLDPSLSHIFNALSIGVQFTLSFQLTNFGLKCLFQRLQPEISKFAIYHVELRSKEYKDGGRKTSRTHQKNLTPLTEKSRIQVQFKHMWNIFKYYQETCIWNMQISPWISEQSSTLTNLYGEVWTVF